jgi:hypothetical protein
MNPNKLIQLMEDIIENDIHDIQYTINQQQLQSAFDYQNPSQQSIESLVIPDKDKTDEIINNIHMGFALISIRLLDLASIISATPDINSNDVILTLKDEHDYLKLKIISFWKLALESSEDILGNLGFRFVMKLLSQKILYYNNNDGFQLQPTIYDEMIGTIASDETSYLNQTILFQIRLRIYYEIGNDLLNKSVVPQLKSETFLTNDNPVIITMDDIFQSTSIFHNLTNYYHDKIVNCVSDMIKMRFGEDNKECSIAQSERSEVIETLTNDMLQRFEMRIKRLIYACFQSRSE